MNLRIIIFYITIFLSLNIVAGQGKDLLPEDLPLHLFGTWFDDETGQVCLLITKDYLIVEDEIWYYKYINTEDNIKISITCINETRSNIFQFFVNSDKSAYFYYNRKDFELIKDENKIKRIPDDLLGNWLSSEDIISIKNKDMIIYKEKVFVCDYIAKTKENGYNLVLYNGGNYFLLNIKMFKGEMVLEAFGLTKQKFFKESIFHKYSNWFISLLIIFISIFVYLLVRWRLIIIKRKEQLKRKIVEMQLKSIRSQMNPHFLFNALSAIQNLINKGSHDQANHYLTEFSQLMRLTLDKSEKGLVTLSDEIKSIKKYLELENLRFKFDYSINVDSKIDENLVEIPAMLVQPFVENAIIHGINENENNKKLSIEFKLEEEYLLCIITDNGIGINASLAKVKSTIKRNSYGLKLAEDRIKLINKSHNTKAKLKISDRSDIEEKLTGTVVEIYTPIAY
ncbi:hypothetical protein BFR04_01840 [Gaetbulibacter sp. 4G1]|nr:histidine kinase [Gaetbulibacter sp. 4G1]PIA79611.1 hypothetical protein BFR04_01840 [Gaetbulibacter sp. 4G1]